MAAHLWSAGHEASRGPKWMLFPQPRITMAAVAFLQTIVFLSFGWIRFRYSIFQRPFNAIGLWTKGLPSCSQNSVTTRGFWRPSAKITAS